MQQKASKMPIWLATVCVASITMGGLLFLMVTSPQFAPDLMDKAERRGLTRLIQLIAVANVAGPIAALWNHCRTSHDDAEDL